MVHKPPTHPKRQTSSKLSGDKAGFPDLRFLFFLPPTNLFFSLSLPASRSREPLLGTWSRLPHLAYPTPQLLPALTLYCCCRISTYLPHPGTGLSQISPLYNSTAISRRFPLFTDPRWTFFCFTIALPRRRRTLRCLPALRLPLLIRLLSSRRLYAFPLARSFTVFSPRIHHFARSHEDAAPRFDLCLSNRRAFFLSILPIPSPANKKSSRGYDNIEAPQLATPFASSSLCDR